MPLCAATPKKPRSSLSVLACCHGESEPSPCMVVYSLELKKRKPSTPPMTYSRPSTSTTPAPPRAVFIGEVLCQTPAWLGEQTRRLRAMSRHCVIYMLRVFVIDGGPLIPHTRGRELNAPFIQYGEGVNRAQEADGEATLEQWRTAKSSRLPWRRARVRARRTR